MARPVLFVLAGVNGAGKSSIGGLQLRRAGLAWFNPDTFARDVAPGDVIPDPTLVLHLVGRVVHWPRDPEALRGVPDWAKPLVEAALALGEGDGDGV